MSARAHCPATGVHTQTLESQWGRPPLTVDAVIPTVMLRHRLGRVHIGESDRHVLRIVFDGIRSPGNQMRDRYTRDVRKQTYRAALWLHHENIAEYRAVMSGRF